jgi:hypothetical protein
MPRPIIDIAAMRSTPQALSISIALHAAVLLALVTFRYETGSPSPGTANVIRGELIRFTDDTQSSTTPPTEDESEELADAPPAAEPPPSERLETVAELRPADAASETAPPAPAEAPPDPTLASEPPDLAPVSAAESGGPEPLDTPLHAPGELPTPTVIDELAELPADAGADALAELVAVVDERAEPPAVDIETVPMAARQREMLTEKFASWTDRATIEPSKGDVFWSFDGQQYTAAFEELAADDETALGRVIVEVSTEQNGNRLSTELTMKQLAFSSFAQFVDRWDPEVQIHDDEIDGRFHSNTELHLKYGRDTKPVFRGRVTTASRSIRTDATGRVHRDRMFLAGLETGVRRVVFPRLPFPLGDGPAVDEKQIQRFAEDTRITFHADGSFTSSGLVATAAAEEWRIPDRPYYIVAERDTKLHVKGRVNGNVLVYSPERIVIEGDLTYAEFPPVDDYLGLVSDRSIDVAEPEVTGGGDLAIHASIYAKSRFAVRSYSANDNAMLFIYGSVSAGSITATEPRFATKIEFDPRLENVRPPSFPLTDRYELEPWDGIWRIDQLPN